MTADANGRDCARHGQLKRSCSICEMEAEISELRTLVDGAMDVIEIYKPQGPAQTRWQAEWMLRAREATR